ncbi:G protein-activated inward rectifier potassium channel 3-like isoform X2 [Ischnura elegans]|uniref:G protein-activated inward rectifier potassium channel 3-like isoform X2 n=1 Tax=Ischnura elegans TaxID=197161 RepID=UPI001ED88FF5|nr:G protein-activated inward rectifier potassium channel 3-like isoform X2 [Ischnura elegans]
MKDTDLENHALSSANDGPLAVSHDSPLLALEPTPAVISPAINRVSDCSLAERTDGITPKSRTRVRSGTFGGTRKFRKRVVLKNGDCNVLQTNISKRRLRYLQDIFTTLVDVQWRWTLLVFALSFILSWLAFAVIWWLIAFTHGDLEPGNVESSDWRPCVVELKSFASCFLFSVETQHTIGYGSRSTTEECPEAIFVMCLQSITGVMIQAFMVGIVFAKMSRPKNRAQTLLFSRNAVVCQRDGHLCLMFRVGDMRKSHIIGARVRAQLIRSRTTKEGETLGMYQYELSVGADSDRDDVFFIWPMTVVHRIDESSPLYDLSAAEMLRDRFEIVVILEGCIESTGQTTQARSSYLPGEILWGHRFQSLVSFNKSRAGYEVDYSLFNDTYEVDTPLCSAKALAEFYRIQDELRRSDLAQSLGFLHSSPNPASSPPSVAPNRLSSLLSRITIEPSASAPNLAGNTVLTLTSAHDEQLDVGSSSNQVKKEKNIVAVPLLPLECLQVAD